MVTMAVIPLRDIVIFPKVAVSFDVTRQKSKLALEVALESKAEVFAVAQREPDVNEPNINDLYTIGTVCRVKQLIRIPNGGVRVMLEGVCRAEMYELTQGRNFATAVIDKKENDEDTTQGVSREERDAYLRVISEAVGEYFSYNKALAPEVYKHKDWKDSLSLMVDRTISAMQIDYREKQKLHECLDVYERAENLIESLRYEIGILRIAKQISDKTKASIDKNQREYFLREEMKIIEQEIEGDGGGMAEVEEFREKLVKLELSKDVSEKLEKEITRFSRMQASSADRAVLRNYLDTVLELPWNTKSEENRDIAKAEQILDKDHYGLEKVKERIVEQLAVRTLNNGKEGTLICLVGPPGVGKTSVARSIARAMGREYVRVSLGGIRDEAEIRGHRKTYIGAMPGRIISAVISAKTNNPLILLDEIDKLGSDIKGDPAAALLEVLDYEQNHDFKDHYIEVPFDLSDVMFVTTANTLSTIPAPLLDRLEVIELSGYTNEEKVNIARYYLIPKQKEKCGLKGRAVTIRKDAIEAIISGYTRESGVRQLERRIAEIMRKLAKKAVNDELTGTTTITAKRIEGYLGNRKFCYDPINSDDLTGVVRGLAWTAVGGDTLSVEANVMSGTGKLELTGQLGSVMKESAQAAVSYIRTRAEELNIDSDFYKTKDIHIHVPAGAVPKDGPSAGITIATAVASALTGIPVRRDIAMTGEITLRGRVLPIGGLKEKSIAAHRAGIKTVLIPVQNTPDMDEIPETVRNEIKFVPVESMDEVLEEALIQKR